MDPEAQLNKVPDEVDQQLEAGQHWELSRNQEDVTGGSDQRC